MLYWIAYLDGAHGVLHDPEGDVVEVEAVDAGAVVDEGEDEVEQHRDDDREPVEEGLWKGRIITAIRVSIWSDSRLRWLRFGGLSQHVGCRVGSSFKFNASGRNEI